MTSSSHSPWGGGGVGAGEVRRVFRILRSDIKAHMKYQYI